MTDYVPYRTDGEIAEVVHQLESCQYQKDEFPHFRHLAVAAWYLSHYSREESLLRMRSALLNFTSNHGVSAYHETITQFWLRLTDGFLRHAPSEASLVDRINALIQELARKELVFDYYSRAHLMSDEARNGWVAPDLRDLEEMPAENPAAKTLT